ncbi:MAG: EamA family transporter [Beijerinckiaceae bacterium]
MTTPAHPLLGGAAALVGAISYGINIPAARVAGQAGINGSNLAFQRGIVLIAILALVILALGKSFRMDRGEEKRIISLGLLAGLTGVCYLSSLTYVPVAIAVTVFYTFPLVLILIGPFTGKGPITPSRLVAFIVAFSGIVLCVGPSAAGLDWRGVALAFMASLSCAALFHGTADAKQDRLTLMFWMQVFAQLIIVPVALATGVVGFQLITANWLPIVISALGFYIGFAGQIVAGGLLRPATVGLLFLLEPIVAILSAAVFMDERLAMLQYIGITLVISGLALDVWMQSRSGTT